MNSRTRITVTLGVAGILLGVGALFAFLLSFDGSSGDVAGVEASLSSPVVALPPAVTPTSSPDLELGESSPLEEYASQPTLAAPNDLRRLDELSATIPAAPTRILIGDIAVDAPVEPHGVNPRTGQMAVPRNVSDVAWYQFGPSPGSPGSAVLAAHVDLAGQGPGVFYRLRDLEPGDEISVQYDDGSVMAFVVEARVTYDKDDLPLDTVFSRQGSPVLTLVTCGGGFSENSQSYDSNVVVYALPLGSRLDRPST